MVGGFMFQYDREADILSINTVSPYSAQESEGLGDEIIARLNPETGLFFTTRLLRGSGSPLRESPICGSRFRQKWLQR